MNRGRQTRRKTNRKMRIMGVALLLVLVLIFVVTSVILVMRVTQNPKSEENFEAVSLESVEPTEGLSENVFLSNNLVNVVQTGNVELTEEDRSQVEKWESYISTTNTYHMTITEKETYNADDVWYKLVPSSGNHYTTTDKSLSQTQTRNIDVYLTLDSNKNQWYLIQIAEEGFSHSSSYSIMPGVYFFRADGSSSIETINGEVTGEEKEKLRNVLNCYLLPNYCDLENLAGRMGTLTSESANFENGGATILLESENGELEISGTQYQMDSFRANYLTEAGDEKYEITVDIQYGTVFTADDVNIICENPYGNTGTMEELKFRNDLDSATVTLSDTNKANELWQKIEIPEEFCVRATLNTQTSIKTNRQTSLDNEFVIKVQRQLLGEEIFTRVEVTYKKREAAGMNLEAGVYIFNDTYIWTDRGIMLVAEAQNLYEMLQSFRADTYFNVKWQLGLCGNLYLETYKPDSNYEFELIEADKPTGGFVNYAKIDVNQNNQVEVFQTNVRFRNEEEIGSTIDFEATIEYEPDEIAFTIPLPTEE